MASTEGLVPITRSFLASYYDKYPFQPLSDDLSRLCPEIRSLANDLLKECPPTQGEIMLVNEAERQPPHKIDENMWKNREHIEEIIFLLERSHWPEALQQQSTPYDAEVAIVFDHLRDKFQNTLKHLESFQSMNSERVFNTVMTYMPQDFRGTLIRQQRERSERNKQAEVDALVNYGGSIGDRYALLWKQQMDRRRQLAQLGSATGVYKTLVKYLVGVPQALLDFIRQINDDEGPMEEQRHRYGPPLYNLTLMVLSIRLFLSLSWGRFGSRKLKRQQVAVLERAVDVYVTEFERFINFISEVFANSPFFISAEVAGTLEARKNDDYKEISVPSGKTYEVSLTVDSINSYIAWDFSIVQGKINMDIGFSVEFTNHAGEKSLMLPYRRYDSDQGNFCTCMAGCYKLIWDNSYSSFFKKQHDPLPLLHHQFQQHCDLNHQSQVLRYKVDCIPPVTESVQTD
ncbi:GOLD domain containing protein [Quillaja saponaria]|uniref:GOLD domain containing protein n=1 Tax=Quillaja saponaria TaxID=32244 RepID=A0AAD7L3Z2_QUISA|nr:GOLD domain containing protein [Quillaja saponaria]